MSTASATEYAESIAQQIRANVESGYPFGYDEERAEYGESAELGAYDYLEGVLDIQYLVDSDRSYRAARVCIAFGGPTAWINTFTHQIECAWWSETVTADLPSEFILELDAALEELWEMGA